MGLKEAESEVEWRWWGQGGMLYGYGWHLSNQKHLHHSITLN